MVVEHNQWRIENFPCKPADYMRYLTRDMVYLCKRDKWNHPIVVINCQAILKEDVRNIELQRYMNSVF